MRRAMRNRRRHAPPPRRYAARLCPAVASVFVCLDRRTFSFSLQPATGTTPSHDARGTANQEPDSSSYSCSFRCAPLRSAPAPRRAPLGRPFRLDCRFILLFCVCLCFLLFSFVDILSVVHIFLSCHAADATHSPAALTFFFVGLSLDKL